MDRVVVAVAIIAVVAVVAVIARSRRKPDAPTQRTTAIPDQLDRSDFDRPEAPWLVAVVDDEYLTARSLHERYAIAVVPTLVVADSRGVSRAGFVGPMSATDLWAAVAECRQPGTSPEPDLGRTRP